MEKSFVPTNLVINKLIKFNIQKQFTIIHLSSTSTFPNSPQWKKACTKYVFKKIIQCTFWCDMGVFFVFSKVVQV
jgi:hypothetical protein